MKPPEFRKLPINLPRQPLVNQRPWLIAGLLLASAILLIAACSYYAHTKRLTRPERQERVTSDRTEQAKKIS